MFTFGSKYNLGDEDQYDVNKLFGIGSMMIHRNSDRFGWRYDTLTNKFLIYAYYYRSGVRYTELLASVVANHWVSLSISIKKGFTEYAISQGGSMLNIFRVGSKRRFFNILLGPYFGGNRTAPKSLELYLKK